MKAYQHVPGPTELEYSYCDLGDARVRYIDVGSGPAVMLIHGSPVFSYTFRHQVAALAPHFRVIAPDLVGFGGSTGPDSQGVGFSAQAGYLRRFLDTLDLADLVLVAHDWGGPIAVACVAERPEQLRGLVLVNTTLRADFRPPWYWRPLVGQLLGNLVVVRMNLVRLALRTLLRSVRDKDVRETYQAPLRALATRRTVLALERLEGFSESMAGVEGRLEPLQVPTLLLWGQPDPYFREPEIQRLRTLFSHATLTKIPGGGHFPQEDASEVFSTALIEFLKGLTI